jgi:hypothetical protein
MLPKVGEPLPAREQGHTTSGLVEARGEEGAERSGAVDERLHGDVLRVWMRVLFTVRLRFSIRPSQGPR